MTDPAEHEAKFYLRLIRKGAMTAEQARDELLPDEKQMARVWQDYAIFWREIELRKQTWRRLQILLGRT
jgi:hypothetical protein